MCITGALTVPVRDVLIGDAGSDVEHDDTALSVDVVTISETTKLLLPSGVPHIEDNLTEILLMLADTSGGGDTAGHLQC